MSNKDLKWLIFVTGVQTTGLISLWGITNYISRCHGLDETTIFDIGFYKFNFKITGRIFGDMALLGTYMVFATNLLMYKTHIT